MGLHTGQWPGPGGGIGTGRNLRWYPQDVEVVGVDVSPNMLHAAQVRAEKPSRSVELYVGDAHRLPFADASFDTVVATLTLCSIPAEWVAVHEMARVLRPGGRLILLDHVASPIELVRVAQRLLDPLMVRFEGDHLLREPDVTVRNQGLVIDELTRSKWGIVARLAAHKPGETTNPPVGTTTQASCVDGEPSIIDGGVDCARS